MTKCFNACGNVRTADPFVQQMTPLDSQPTRRGAKGFVLSTTLEASLEGVRFVA